ncbi:MAG: ATP-binding protein [Dysgonamonadaceae bacterium]|jgi:hypothetical protein|nr:ATP-binding protein [Dysgonamonadaceae bacterium]
MKPYKLPAGIQTFDKIIEGNFIYVDKTKYLVDLIEGDTIYFFARPRRFGKSLTVSTLDALFSGKKELFKGLYAEEYMNRADYYTSPVIRLDMSGVTTDSGIEMVKKSIHFLLDRAAARYALTLEGERSESVLFDELIQKIAGKHGKVVILLDEYDKPYNEFVNNLNMAEQVREVLRNFYVRIKKNDEYIRFVFITGISKFARFGVFSGLNSPVDISLDPKYGEMCGLTEEEILQYFPEYIKETAENYQLSTEALVEKMRNYYDGFCFDGIHRLYNPYSALCFFLQKEFDNFWMESGTTKMIADYLKSHTLTVEQFRGMTVSRDFVRNPGELDNTPPEGFLYQGGYLTLRKKIDSFFILDYPNTEVLNSMSALLANNLLRDNDEDFSRCRSNFINALYKKDAERLKIVLNRLLASVPYDDFKRAAEDNISDNDYPFSVYEWHYRSIILAFLRGCGVATVAEMHTHRGRPDLVLMFRGNTYIIELKVAYTPEDVETKLQEAITQITEKNYLAPYPNVTALALVIDDMERRITGSEIINFAALKRPLGDWE